MDEMMPGANAAPIQETNAPSQDGIFSPEESGQSGGLSFDSKQIEGSLKEQMDDAKVSEFNRVLDAGNKMLFNKDMHYQVLDGFQAKEGPELATEMADGALGMTGMLIEKSGGTLPGGLIIPAATVLLARVGEFMNKTGMANVTDDVYEESVHQYTVKLKAQYDPEFREKIEGSQGAQQEQQPEQAQPTVPVQSGGLLNQGGI